MTPVPTAHHSFKTRYPRNLEICLGVGTLLHLAMIFFTPPVEIAPYKMEVIDSFRVVDTERISEIRIPDPPPEVIRPTLPGDLSDLFLADDPLMIDIPVAPDLNPFERPAVAGLDSGVGPHLIVESKPTILRKVQPVYPELAREAGAEGTVKVEVTVDPTGHVTKSRIVYSDTIQSLERAAIEAAQSYLFSPARQQSLAVSVRVVLQFEFSLH